MIPLTRAIPERIRGGLRRCAIQVGLYFTSLYFTVHVPLLTLTSTFTVIRVRKQMPVSSVVSYLYFLHNFIPSPYAMKSAMYALHGEEYSKGDAKAVHADKKSKT